MKNKYKKKIKKKFRKFSPYQWDEVTLHGIFMAALLFVFFLYASVFFSLGTKVKNEKVDIANVKYPTKTERNINKIVAGYPIMEMASHIAGQDKITAAFLVAIAKKESNWGKYSPKKLGKECYNYWGYRGSYNKTASGYSCFDSPEQAVEVVGGRIEALVNQKVDTPQKMVVWKCGSSCAGHEAYSVRKWIQDVDLYFNKIYN